MRGEEKVKVNLLIPKRDKILKFFRERGTERCIVWMSQFSFSLSNNLIHACIDVYIFISM